MPASQPDPQSNANTNANTSANIDTNAETETAQSDQFELYDLEVVVEAIQGDCTCNMALGDRFFLCSGKLSLPPEGDFCLYALQAAIPLLPAKQRRSHPADWMETDTRVTCPDPACRLIMRIDRTAVRRLHHDETSPIPWDEIQDRGKQA